MNLTPILGALVEWREAHATAAEIGGAEMFMGLPDAWFDAPYWFCTNGHVSRTYLRTDLGSRCLACRGYVLLGPPMTEEEFGPIIRELKAKADLT